MLSQMVRQMFTGNPLVVLPTIGLAIFMTVFTIVTIRVLRRRGDSYDDVARLPLDDDQEVRHGR
jgi:hypothetical protein